MKISTALAFLLAISYATPTIAQCTVTPNINSSGYYNAVSTAYSTPCGSSSANLSGLTASNQPSGTTLTWHSATPALTSNRITPVTNITGGTRKVYAAFFNAASDCYTPTKEIIIYASICAADDDYSATVVPQGVATTLPSIFSNDTYNGVGIPTPHPNITFVYELWNTSYATVNPDGTINVLPSTPVGTYTFIYKIIDADPDAVSGSSASWGMVTIVVGTTPLPVSLTAFDVKKEANTINVHWTTASEQHNVGFAVERNEDGQQGWKEIGFVASRSATAGSAIKLDYNFLDKEPRSGDNYYRLKQIDIDGSTTYSAVKKITFTGSQSLSLYPNPVQDKLTIEGLSKGSLLRVYDATGKMLHQQKASADIAVISLQAYNTGMYQVQVIAEDGEITSHKILKLN